MESQFGLFNVWAQGDWVTRAVALLLLGMSLASWMVIVIKALDIVRYKKLARQAETFWHSADFAEGLTTLGSPDDNPFLAKVPLISRTLTTAIISDLRARRLL